MTATVRRSRLTLITGLVVVVGLALAPGCARKYRAEQDGKDAGEALCDVRDADTAEEAQEAIGDLNEELDDISDNFSTFTAEDRADIDENVTDLIEHIRQDNDVLAQQDITVIRRSIDNIRDDLGDTGRAAIDGFFQGLDDCDNG